MAQRSLKKEKALIDELEREFCESEAEGDRPVLSFREFVDRIYPKYQWYRHCIVLADVLQRVADGEIKRLMVFMPPRAGKSLLTSKLFPAYYLYRHPDRYFGINSYAADLAYTLSRAARDAYREVGGGFKDDANAVKHWETNSGGGCWAAGVGGPITGKGYSCFPAETPILTRFGSIDIATLFRLQCRTDVLSFNHATGQCEWKPVIAAIRRRAKTKLIELTTGSGRVIRSTGDHPFYVQGFGYKQAADLEPGDRFITAVFTQQQNLPDLQPSQKGQRGRMQTLLPSGKAFNCDDPEVRFLPETVSETALPAREGAETGLQRHLLLGEMLSISSCHQKSAQVSNLQPTDSDRCEQKVLLTSVLEAVSGWIRSQRSAVARQNLSRLRQGFHALQFATHLLFADLCKSSAFATNERLWKLTLQNWNQLRQVVSRNASADSGSRWKLLRSLRQGDDAGEDGTRPNPHGSGDSSHRQRSDQQSLGKSRHPLRYVPCDSPQVGADTVSLVKELREEKVEVYDLEVEGNHNFFAEGLLVHNCGLIDDPLKNAEEAFSDRIRGKQKEWWESTFYTRNEPDGVIIVVQTRWHQDDLSGWLLSQEANDDEPEGWHIVNFEAIKSDEPIQIPASCTLEPDWRQPGEALCPERFGLAKLRRIMRKVGTLFWNALYQQRPSSLEGGCFKRGWWKFYRVPPSGFDLIILSWDCAFKETTTSDYVVGQVWGKKGGDFYLLDQVRDRMDINATLTAVRTLSAKYPQASAKLVEDKANGSAVIDLLKRQIPGLIAVNPEGGKLVRAIAVSPYVEAGNVYLPDPAIAPWVHDLIEECASFPNGANDDQVDCLSQALHWLQTARPMQWGSSEASWGY